MFKRSFYSLLTTQTVANAADILYITALTVLVLEQTSSLLSAVFIPLLRVGAQMISSFLAPLLLAVYQLPFLLFVSQGVQLLFFAALAAYLQYGPQEPALAAVLALVFAMSFMDGWTTPARNALIPRLAPGDSLMKANSLMALSDRIVQFAGWGLSGLLVSVIGPEPTLLLAAVCYAASFLFTPLIRDPLERKRRFWAHPRTDVKEHPARTEPDSRLQTGPKSGPQPLAAEQSGPEPDVKTTTPGAGSKGKLALLREGFGFIAVSPRLRTLAVIDIIETLGATVWVGAFTLAYVQDVLGQGEAWWGYINAVYFAGTVIGSFGVLTLVRKLRNRVYGAMLAGMASYAVLTFLYAFGEWPPAALVLVLLMGPVAELAYIARQTLIQQSADAAILPKVTAAQNTIVSFTSMVSLLLLGWAADRLGIVAVYVLTAALTVCAVLFGLLARRAFAASSAAKADAAAVQHQ